MTVHTKAVKAQFKGDGSARVWPYPFPCADENWIRLWLSEGGKTVEVTRDYAVDLEARTVTYPVQGAALTSTQTLTVVREVPLEQSLDLVNQGTLEAESLEAEFDEVVQMLQQLDEKLSRCVMADVTEDAPAADYDELRSAAAEARAMAERAGHAADGASASAILARDAAGEAERTAQSAAGATENALSAARAAAVVAEAAEDFVARAEAAATSAEADRVKAYSNAEAAHRYFCRVWGTLWPFIRWFMSLRIIDGKCSRVFGRNPPAAIVDGGSCDTVVDLSVGIYDGRRSEPLEWYVVNPLVYRMICAVGRIKGLLALADTAQSSLEAAVRAADAAAARAAAAIGEAEDYGVRMSELADAAAESAKQSCCCARKSCRAAARTRVSEANAADALGEVRAISGNLDGLREVLEGGTDGQVLVRTADGWAWKTVDFAAR
ncbi:MAG: hypothetical protein ACOYD9_08840 [Pyramidobacter sp.]|jgi:hypothetical protein